MRVRSLVDSLYFGRGFRRYAGTAHADHGGVGSGWVGRSFGLSAGRSVGRQPGQAGGRKYALHVPISI